jgi:hypothetical protein
MRQTRKLKRLSGLRSESIRQSSKARRAATAQKQDALAAG